jgi:hypothetical protein
MDPRFRLRTALGVSASEMNGGSYRSGHVPPMVSLVSVPRLPTLMPRPHAFTGGMPVGQAMRDMSWRQLDAGPGRRRFGGYGQETRYKSDKVPAPGLEPGRPSFKGWWAANYPTPDRYRSALRNLTVSAVPRYRPGSGGGIGRLLGAHRSPPAVRSASRRAAMLAAGQSGIEPGTRRSAHGFGLIIYLVNAKQVICWS